MSARFNVGVIDNNGDAQTSAVVRVKTTAGDTLVASTEADEYAAGGVDEITNNTDGNYYLDSLDSGNYYVTIDGVSQPELANIEWDDIDNQTHIANSSKHREIDDGAGSGDNEDLWSANKIYNELDGKLSTTDVDDSTIEVSDGDLQLKDSGITAAKLGALSVTNAKIGIEAVKFDNINVDNNDFEEDGTQLSIKQSFSDETIIDEAKTLNENLERLQKHQLALEGATGGIKRRIIYSDFERADGTTNDVANSFRTYDVDNEACKVIRFPFYKNSSDTSINVYFEGISSDTTKNEVRLIVEEAGGVILATQEMSDAWADYSMSCSLTSYGYNSYVIEIWADDTVTAQIRGVIVEVVSGE